MRKSNDYLWRRLRIMPPLSHWPDRSLPFDYAKSEVVAFIERFSDNIRHAVSLFNQAKKNGTIRFDPISKLWQGEETLREVMPARHHETVL